MATEIANKLKRIRLLAADLDGTLTREETIFDVNVIKSVRKLESSMVRVTLCSGRSLRYLVGVARVLGSSGPIIAEGGAIVYDLLTNQVDRLVNPDATRTLREKIEELIPSCRVLTTPDQEKEIIITLRSDRLTVEELYDKVSAKLGKEFDILYSRYTVDVLPKGLNKGTGLAHVVGLLKLTSDQVAAVGDAENDIPLLLEAGLKVAVGDASQKLRQIADHVCTKSDGEGFSEVADIIYNAKNRSIKV